MSNILTTYHGALLDPATTALVYRLAQSVASMHHGDGDELGRLAREVLRVWPTAQRATARESETLPVYEWRPESRYTEEAE